MEKIGFIRLDKPEKARHCCLLAEKHFQEGKRVLIVVNDREQGKQLDRYLWTWRKSSFIPHALVPGEGPLPEEPVLIAVGCDSDCRADILIMVHPCPVEFIRRFSAGYDFAELYDPALQEESRQRYALYREAGLGPYMCQ
jgi:DNA polymerase-3 subunit chi